MIKIDDAALARKEADYPGFLEQLYCFERAHYIDPYNREALDGINQLQRAAQQRLPVTAVVRRPWGTSAIDEL